MILTQFEEGSACPEDSKASIDTSAWKLTFARGYRRGVVYVDCVMLWRWSSTPADYVSGDTTTERLLPEA